MAPLDLGTFDPWVVNLTNLFIGLGFGLVLEMSGFGDSRRLSAQFYLKDMTVLKVMFSAIVTAATLIFLGSSLGWIDFHRIFVNPTYLAPHIVGGLIMGAGFIIGGFCPGTSLVAAGTLKLDGWVFLSGVSFGLFLFGETLPHFDAFYNSTAMGRFTLADWLGIDAGWALLGVVLMALAMFYGGEIAEALFGRGESWSGLSLKPRHRGKIAAASLLGGAALLTALIGQPDGEKLWERLAPEAEAQLQSREVYVHPAEVSELQQNAAVSLMILDLRPEEDFNLFHLLGARRINPEEISSPTLISELGDQPPNRVIFLISNGEESSTRAWKELRARHIGNIYIIEGGYNGWLGLYPPPACLGAARPGTFSATEERFAYDFRHAVGDRILAAHPKCACKEFIAACPDGEPDDAPSLGKPHEPHSTESVNFTPKVKMKTKSAPKGGCS